MWHTLLAIQERLFGDDRREMLTTFKKIASLYFQTGNPISAAKYFEKAQGLLETSVADGDLSPEARKELLES